MEVPIVIICHNNYKYVENTVNQLVKIDENLRKNIIILDNISTYEDTKEYLKRVNIKVIFNSQNEGPWITETRNRHIYDTLPDKFILTDPDLEFNPNLPKNFVEILVGLSNKYPHIHKIGFALDISDYDKMYKATYTHGKTIYDWESQFWQVPINDSNYELYHAEIDTTFSLITKNRQMYNNSIRIAGNFTAKHLPWYIDNKIYNFYDSYNTYANMSDISTIKSLIMDHINQNYVKIQKNDIYFLINDTADDPNLHFWKNIYNNWEIETFQVFDQFLRPDKIFIDIGAWIGTTSIYGSRKSKHVYSIEADNESIKSLEKNCRINCYNYTIVHNAIYNEDDIDVHFGKNKFMKDSKLNDSTSQLYLESSVDNLEDIHTIKTIKLDTIVKKYNIDYSNISLIKVDIEGGEENILDDLYEIYTNYHVPLYVSFHCTWWNNTDLDRFPLLNEDHKNKIRNHPFTSILFA